MPELQTQQFIREHGLPLLVERYAIKVRRHGEFPNLVHLKYNQINSPMGEPIVQECRGMILDEADDWRVVSYPLRKFFNHGEGHAAVIDWSTAQVQEKLDGSLMVLYWYAGQWRVASSGTPDASGPVYGHAGTFADLFWSTWRAMGWELPLGPADGYYPSSYIFEMTTPFNRVVVPHRVPSLTCIGWRIIDPSKAYREATAVEAAKLNGWLAVSSYPLQTIDDVVAAATALNPADGEGFVVVDAAFNRVKVKSPAYVALAHAKDGCGPSKLLDLVRLNESAEFLSYFPEMAAAHAHVAGLYDAHCDEVDAAYRSVSGATTQKDFALAIRGLPGTAAMFAMRAGKVASVREFYATATPGALEKVLRIDPAVVTRLLGRCAPEADVTVAS